jgi:O-antigen/teichoic acid export membrane protein
MSVATAPPVARGGVGRASVTLILSSFASSAIGLLYWLIVARQLSKEQVGLDSAVVNTVTLVTTLGSLDLVNAIPRFLPAAGHRAARFIRSAYAVAIGLALVIAAAFLLGVRTWTPSLTYLVNDRTWTVWFLISVVVWAIFVLQDCVLIGFQRSQWIPIENISFAVLKLGSLIVLLELTPRYAVLLSWTLPAFVVVMAVNLRLVRPIVQHDARLLPDTLPPTRSIARSVLVGNSANIVGIVVGGSLPLLVTERLGAEANASYYLAWTMAYVLFLAPRYVSLVVLARAEHDRESFDDLVVDATLASMAIVAASVAVAVAGAGPLLGLVGDAYQGDTVLLLRIMCLAAIPHCVAMMAGAWARGRQRLRLAVAITTAEYTLVALLVMSLVGPLGVLGLGWAWLLAECVIAVGLIIAAVRSGVVTAGRVATSTRRGLAFSRQFVARRGRRPVADAVPGVENGLLEGRGRHS